MEESKPDESRHAVHTLGLMAVALSAAAEVRRQDRAQRREFEVILAGVSSFSKTRKSSG
jgi:hypothetical protein